MAQACHPERLETSSFYVPLSLALVLATMVSACKSAPPFVWVSNVPPQPAAAAPSTIGVGDTLSIVVQDQTTLSGERQVGADGSVVVPVLGPIAAAGKRPEDLTRELEAKLARVVVEPKVSVVILARRLEVSVVGEVQRPGKYDARPTDSVLNALASAGGLTEFADEERIFLVRRSLGARVRFRYDDLVGNDPESLGFALHDGDVVVVE